MNDLARTMNALCGFGRKPARKAPAVHVVNGITITKVRGLWTAKLPGGDTLFSSHLGDLKYTITNLRNV